MILGVLLYSIIIFIVGILIIVYPSYAYGINYSIYDYAILSSLIVIFTFLINRTSKILKDGP